MAAERQDTPEVLISARSDGKDRLPSVKFEHPILIMQTCSGRDFPLT
jgi:hypothetical protein